MDNSFTSHYLPSSSEMNAWDSAAIDSGIPAIELMERAGIAIAQVLMERLAPDDLKQPVTILCGNGNNGGDGLVVARILREKGFFVNVIVSAAPRYSEEFKKNFERLGGVKHLFGGDTLWEPKTQCETITEGGVYSLLSDSRVIIDSLLGSGQTKAPKENISLILDVVERCSGLKISVDVPTGIDPSSGEVFSHHFCADLTIAIQFIKRGLTQFPAKSICGEFVVVDIGISGVDRPEFEYFQQRERLPFKIRSSGSHKYDFGKVLVIGGSRQMPGAPRLSANAALRSGAGLVTLLASQIEPDDMPELVFMLMPAFEEKFDERDFESIQEKLPLYQALVVGPGIGLKSGSAQYVQKLLREIERLKLRCVIDADALTHLGNALREGESFSLPTCVLTPHEGEAARLLGVSVAEIQRDRFSAAKRISSLTNSVAVLKGSGTIVFADDHGIVNTVDTPFLATPGSGDVLSGIIASLLAQGSAVFDAASYGVYIHGRSGVRAHDVHNGPIIATDIIEQIPYVLGELYR